MTRTLCDIPVICNVRLWERENRKESIFRSKAVGEPPLMLAMSVFHALRDAVASIADDRLIPKLNAPATPQELLFAVGELRLRDQASGSRPQ